MRNSWDEVDEKQLGLSRWETVWWIWCIIWCTWCILDSFRMMDVEISIHGSSLLIPCRCFVMQYHRGICCLIFMSWKWIFLVYCSRNIKFVDSTLLLVCWDNRLENINLKINCFTIMFFEDIIYFGVKL